MKHVLCAFALCCAFAFNVRADEVVITPTGGQLTWTHFQGPASDVASLTLTAPGFSAIATNQEAIGRQWGGLCPINCTGSVTFNGFTTGSFNWSASAEGTTATGIFNLFAPGSIPVPPGSPLPPPLFTIMFTASGIVVVDNPGQFVFVVTDPAAVPEPATILLLSSGLIGVAGAMFKKRPQLP